MYKILIVEDEKNLAALVLKYLCTEGYEVKLYSNGEEALQDAELAYDLWILDIMLPGIISGYDLIKKIREKSPTKPVIFTSARDQDIDKIMKKPMTTEELFRKILNILKDKGKLPDILDYSLADGNSVPIRTYEFNSTIKTNKNLLLLGNYILDKDRRSVSFQNDPVSLTSKEYDLLLYLAENPSKAFSRDQILNAVWGEDYFGSDRVVDDLLRRLRSKMPELQIETIYGYGYRLIP